MPLPSAIATFVSAVVGVPLPSTYTTPRSVTGTPPVAFTVPPSVAVVAVMASGMAVVTSGAVVAAPTVKGIPLLELKVGGKPPPIAATLTLPVTAPLGTTMPVIWVPAGFTAKPELTTLLAVPAKTMALVPNSRVPFRVMVLPGTPLAINLVIDSDEYMTYVTQGMVEASGDSADAWLAVGVANLRDATPDDWLGTFHEETGMLGGHAGDSYDAARALVLEEFGEPSPAGWLVAVPARDWLFALPVTRESLPGVPLLKVLAQKSYAEDAYPICDEVFWVRAGVWELLPVTLTDERADVSPSDAFVAALEELNAIEEGEVGGEA